jgi:hypothetical protein
VRAPRVVNAHEETTALLPRALLLLVHEALLSPWVLCRPQVCSLGTLTKTTRTRIRWRTAGRRLALAVGDLLSTVEPTRRIPLRMLLPHTTRLYAHEPGRRRRLTSLAVMTTMAAGHLGTPGSLTEHARNAKHGSGRTRSTD